MKKQEVIETIIRLADKIGADRKRLPTFENNQYNGTPNIEFLGRYFQYSIQEGNDEVMRRLFTDIDGLLFQVFKDITSSMAMSYEISHRISGADFRRLWFSKQLESLQALNPDWSKKAEKDQLSILRVAPFTDEI